MVERLYDYVPPGYREVWQYKVWILFENWNGTRIRYNNIVATIDEVYKYIVTNIHPREGTLIDFGYRQVIVLESTNEGEP